MIIIQQVLRTHCRIATFETTCLTWQCSHIAEAIFTTFPHQALETNRSINQQFCTLVGICSVLMSYCESHFKAKHSQCLVKELALDNLYRKLLSVFEYKWF